MEETYKIHFKMLIDDGEQYRVSGEPGIAIFDYVDLRGLEPAEESSFWEEQERHYQNHMAFDFEWRAESDSSIMDIANEIAERIGFDRQRFAESHVGIYLLQEGELVEADAPAVRLSTLSKYYSICDGLHIFFMLMNQAGDIWVEDGLRYYMPSKEAGSHNLPHIHVDYRHEASAAVSLKDGRMLEGDIPKKVLKRVTAKVMENQEYLLQCWNKRTDGLRVDLNVYFGAKPLKP